MADYTWAVEAASVKPGTMQFVRLAGKSILLVNHGGTLYAWNDFCTHQKCYLHQGKLSGKVLTCPCHGAEFDVTTGVALSLPAKEPLLPYPVKVDGQDILVEI